MAPVGAYTPITRDFTATSTIEAYVREQAEQSGLGEAFYQTLKYESGNWQNGQSAVVNPNGPNGHEDSWGVCQLFLPSNPDITKEQALDVEFCVSYTISEFKAGHARRWTGYRLYISGLLNLST